MTTAQYLPTRLSSRETGLSAIFRRNTGTPKTWPNPERSVGRLISKVGNQSIWEAQGEARETFKTLAPDIKRYLDGCIEPIPNWVTWSMYMIGGTPNSACPTVIFYCDVAAHRREVRDAIRHSGILNQYPGVKTGHMPRAPDFDQLIPLAHSEAASNNDNKVKISLQLSKSALGIPLFISSCAHDEQRSARATIGGVIRVDAENSTQQTCIENKSNWHVDDDTCSFDGDSDIDFEVDGGLSPLTNDFPNEGDFHANEDMCRSNAKEQEAFEHTTSNEDGYLSSIEEPIRNYESCLSPQSCMKEVKFEYDGEFFLAPRDSPGNEADFALLEVTDSRHRDENIVPILSDKQSMHLSHPFKPLHHAVIYREDYLVHPFQKMLCATFSSMLNKGDCGAWVINTETGDLYGHIVAGSLSSGTALIKPFHDVFEHIRYRTGYLPSFPTNNSEVKLRGRYPTTAQLGDGKASPQVSALTRYEAEPQSLLTRPKDRPNGNMSTRTSVIGLAGGLPDTSGRQGASKDAPSKDKAPQEVEGAVKGWMKPRALRSRLDTREGKKSRKLVYPTFLYPRNGTRIENASMNIRPKNCGLSPSSYATPSTRASSLSVKDSKKFCNILSSLSRTPLMWDNPGLLDEALQRIPLSRIYDEAEDEANTFVAIAMSTEAPHPDWGYQDCVVRALMRWFKNDYFTWVNNPLCDFCLHPTMSRGVTGPNQEERVFSALRVELYQCTAAGCSRFTRFPRYADPMFCIAIGARARWVWNAEDYLWVEIYSRHVHRWVHVDVLQGAWDNPLLYSERWGKAMSYCIAFSTEGAVDVTRRYVRQEKLLKSRNRCSELALFYMLKKITVERRDKLSKENQERLRLEDAAEQNELHTSELEPSYNQQHPKHRVPKNIPSKHTLEEKWLEPTRKLCDHTVNHF
ncbi:hypothetical protein HD806DRAFT_524673 [Xylariaceae sp. AK1471]|nr:hypothetical protein HD806DRAFT_524673 [Xylariaceae sp. AK1471]